MIITSTQNVKYCNLANKCKIRHDYSELLIFLYPQNRLITFFRDSFHQIRRSNGTYNGTKDCSHVGWGVQQFATLSNQYCKTIEKTYKLIKRT